MPSPDITPYVDATLLDVDAGDLLDEALDLAATRLPNWIPREGQTESVLLELVALISSEEVFALNRIPSTVIEVLIKAYGVDRDEGQPATTTVTFTVNDLLGHTVPLGTRVSLDLGAAVDPVLFVTNTDLVIAPGASAGTVAATADRGGSSPNGSPAGSAVQVVDALAFVNSAQLATPVAGGTDLEDDAAYFARALLKFQRLTSSLVLAAHFEEYALEQPYVYRAKAIDLYDPTSGHAPGADQGHVTVAVLGPGGAAVSGANKTALQAAEIALAVAGLTVHVIDATITVVPVTVTVRRFAAYSSAAVQASVTAALQTYLSPDTWEWSGTVRYNELISTVDQAPGVDFVVSITTPPADVLLTGNANLVQAGAIAVTVQDPV